MRVIHTYTFPMSTKTPYSEFPAIARRFLEEQNLVAHRFMYYFDEMICLKSYEETLATGSCAKAVKDCPALGSIRYINVESTADELFLTNIDKDTGCTEADILPHMNKIHRFSWLNRVFRVSGSVHSAECSSSSSHRRGFS